VNITVYRGTHEIGGTLIELKTVCSRILLDAGYPLFLQGKPIDNHIASLPNGQLLSLGVLPDIKGLYKWDSPAFDAVVISHAHIDHYGLLPYVHESIPVFMSGGTKKLIEISQRFRICNAFAMNTRIFQMYQSFSAGDFQIKPYLMDHSAFDAAAFEITGAGKTVIYTGDYRGHGRKAVCLDRFIAQVPRGADALLIEGTMFGRQDEQVLTEEELENQAADMMNHCSGPVLFQSSSQNVDRLVSFFRASLKAKRLFVVDVYTANVLFELRQLGNDLPYPSEQYSNIKVFYPYYLTQRVFNEIGEKYAKRFSAFHMPKDKLKEVQNQAVMLVRPSMSKDIERCKLQNGTFLYSMWQGYRNSEPQLKLEQMLQSAGFLTKSLHTSGHASVSDINRVILNIDSKKIVPIHTMTPDAFTDISGNVQTQMDGISFDI
jgi:ribonuclease J